MPILSTGYVHIDVMKVDQSGLPQEVIDYIKNSDEHREIPRSAKMKIHDHMVDGGNKDPRRKDKMGNYLGDRKGHCHYELWKVENFPLGAFKDMVSDLEMMRDVRVVWMWKNEDPTFIFRTRLLEDYVNGHARQLA